MTCATQAAETYCAPYLFIAEPTVDGHDLDMDNRSALYREVVRRLKGEKNLKAVAEQLKEVISYTYLNQIKNQQTGNVSLDKLLAVAAYYGIPFGESVSESAAPYRRRVLRDAAVFDDRSGLPYEDLLEDLGISREEIAFLYERRKHLTDQLERIQWLEAEIRDTVTKLHGNDMQLRLILKMVAGPMEEAAQIAKKRQESRKGA